MYDMSIDIAPARPSGDDEVGQIHHSESLAVAAVTAYTRCLTRVSFLVGEIGSVALLRRSLRDQDLPFLPYTPVSFELHWTEIPSVECRRRGLQKHSRLSNTSALG